MLPGNVFASTNILARSPMYWSVSDTLYQSANILTSDTIDSVFPRMDFIQQRIHQGDFPFWNPYQLGGGESAGLPNDALFTPLSLPYWLLPLWIAPAVEKILEIATIAVGMSLFLRRIGVTCAAWPFATLLFTSSGFMVALTIWPQSRVTAYIPLLFWSVERLLSKRRWLDVPIVSLILGSMWLAGFPAVTFNTIYVVSAYALVRAFTLWTPFTTRGWGDILRQAVRYSLGIIGSGLIAAFQLLPFILSSKYLIDFDSRAAARGSHIPDEALSLTILPNVYGKPDLTGFWGKNNPVEMFGYVGIVGLILAILALACWRRVPIARGIVVFFCVSTLILMLAMYWGGPLLLIIQDLPTMSTSLFGRMRSVTGFLVAVLASLGLHYVMQQQHRRHLASDSRRWWVVGDAIGVIIAATVTSVLVWETTRAVLDSPQPATSLKWIAATFAAAGIMVVILIAIIQFRKLSVRAIAGVVVIFMAFAPAVVVARTWWPINSIESFYPETQATSFLRNNVGNNRVISFSNALYMGVSTAYNVRVFAGRGFMTPEWRDLLQTVQPDVLTTATYAMFNDTVATGVLQNRILDRFGVKYAAFTPGATIPGQAAPPARLGDSTVSLSLGKSVQSATYAGPIRGITVHIRTADGVPGTGIEIDAAVVSPDGEVLARNSHVVRSLSGSVFLAFDADELEASDQWHIVIETSTPEATVGFASGDDESLLAIDLLRPVDDGLNVVDVGDVTILERESSLDRIRWASQADIVGDSEVRLAYMALKAPDDTVVLDEPDAQVTDGPGGGEGRAIVLPGSDVDQTTVRVTSDGPGWVVIADSMRRPGWTATLDGKAAVLLEAEHAGAAVYVPSAGEHILTLRFMSPGFKTGLVVTGATLSAIVLLWGVGGICRYRRSCEQLVSADTDSATGDTHHESKVVSVAGSLCSDEKP